MITDLVQRNREMIGLSEILESLPMKPCVNDIPTRFGPQIVSIDLLLVPKNYATFSHCDESKPCNIARF